jgi:hypothetical protein
VIVNEKNVSNANTCDGTHLKFTFRRSVNQQLMNKWYDLVSVAESLQFSGEDDAIFGSMREKVFILLALCTPSLTIEVPPQFFPCCFGDKSSP